MMWMQVKSDSATAFCILIHSFCDGQALRTTMQHISTYSNGRGGGRAASPAYRQSLSYCDDFAGLEENTNRYGLLLLVKRAGRAAGFSSRMIQLLDYYMAFTRDIDWEQGSRPIIYQSLSRTALDLGVSERQIQKLEKQLFDKGALTWNDSGNHKRYGQRHAQTGVLLYAYGVDLTPLAYLKAELEAKLQDKQLYDDAWMETKRQISWHRRQIRAIILEAGQGAEPETGELLLWQTRYEAIAQQIRTHMDLTELKALLEKHQTLYNTLLGSIVGADEGQEVQNKHDINSKITQKSSCTSERKFSHYKSTNHESSDKSDTASPSGKGFQKSVAEGPEPETKPQDRDNLILATGLQHITLKQVLNAAGDRFRENLPIAARPMNWNDVTEAAYKLRPKLFISQQSWGEACELLGRAGASICVLLTDQACNRTQSAVTQPAAYFRGMINKARSGELRLHNSIFGILKREEEGV